MINKITDKGYTPIYPSYNNFKGTIHKLSSTTFITKGIYSITSKNTIVISELPIGTWTYNYNCFNHFNITFGCNCPYFCMHHTYTFSI